MTTQDQQLSRVSDRIAGAVLDFCKAHTTFRGAELCDYVREQCGGSPESALRVMRDLRKRGALSYKNVDRGRSVYTVWRAFGPGV